METKIFADGRAVTLWWALPNYAVDPENPTAAEVNAALNITKDVAWENYSFGAQASSQNSDPGIGDVGNPQTRGFTQFGGTISFFYPKRYLPIDPTDSTQSTFYALESPSTVGYVLIRVDGAKETADVSDVDKPAMDGDFISVYKVMSDGYADVNTGEVNFKYTITFRPQGDVWVNVIIGNPTLAAITPVGTADWSVGGKTPLTTHFTGRQLSSIAGEFSGYPGWFDWVSSDSEVATVDANGVVVGLSAGTADITATDPVSGASAAPYSVTIA